QTATWLVSRELTNAAGPWNTQLLSDDDGEYFARILLASAGVKFVYNTGVYYRDVPSSRLSYIGLKGKRMKAQLDSMEKNIRYLRSIDDSRRVRMACTTYLQNWLSTFYPERLDLVERACQLAESLGGALEPPRLTWKYSWIQSLFGPSAAKLSQDYYNRLKSSTLRLWDKALFRMVGKSSYNV